MNPASPRVVVIGAGPAGLSAAYTLTRDSEATVTVLEGDSIVGGISRTAERDGWRFDMGGHRFFTKVPEVQRLWHEILPAEDFLMRPRMSRIYYEGKLYDYPLKPVNALRNLGIFEAIRCVLSYAWVRVRAPKDQSHFEGWVAARFGWRLYQIFFKTYTEKLWGRKATELQSDWAAQRIKNLSLWNAITSALRPRRSGGTAITSLIEEFEYPKLGPGMMWERCSELVQAQGGRVVMETKVQKLHRSDGRVTSVSTVVTGGYGAGAGSPASTRTDIGQTERVACDAVVSTMPLGSLVKAMDPPAPAEVLAAADDLKYRDFLTVALVLPTTQSFPDNWIYIHSPEVKVGRIQNFGSWSPFLIKDGRTCLGLEYFVNEGDETWRMSDDDLVALASRELASLGLIDASHIERGYVVRMPKAYPFYDAAYHGNVTTIRTWLEQEAPNVHAVGRNGMHRYNNQDHSMLTALLAVDNILNDSGHDVWAVNVDDDYHEEVILPDLLTPVLSPGA